MDINFEGTWRSPAADCCLCGHKIYDGFTILCCSSHRIAQDRTHAVLSASARAGSPHREFNKYFGAPKTQPDVELRRGSGSIEIKQILSATSRETLFSGTDCPGLVIAPVYYYRRLLSPTSDTHIGLLSPPFSASATSWRLLGHQQAQF